VVRPRRKGPLGTVDAAPLAGYDGREAAGLRHKGSTMQAPTLARSSIERSFYAMLKLHVFATVHDVFLQSFTHGKNGHALQDAKPTLGRFTARKADHLFVPRNGNALRCSADFFGFTPHKVREKLALLEEMGVVVLEGRGLRDAYTYLWTQPVQLHELCSFMVLYKATSDDLSLNIELGRVFEAVGRERFGAQEFVQAYASAHLEEYGGTRWGSRRFERLRGSSEYHVFLRARLRKLVQRGLVAEEGDGFRLTPKALELIHHFQLFVDAVPYQASQAMCQACPLFQRCRVEGRVEPLLEGISTHLQSFIAAPKGEGPNGHVPPGPANGAAPGHGGHAANGNGHAPAR